MQSSSTAYVAAVVAVFALVFSYFPVFLTPDALAQTTLPSPVLGSVVSGTLSATVVATSNTAEPAQAKAAPKVKAVVNAPAATSSQPTTYPRLIIPAIDLNDPIVPVGVDSTGAMAVPNGNTNEVGWYDGGTQPGGAGSAVLDAHIFAAFAKLNELQTGDDIYVEESATQTLHFVVTKTEDFPLSQITSQDLFVPTTDHDLNLITCAGNLTPDHSTYDHRFVVYSTLVN